MRVAIPAASNKLEGSIDSRFGRSNYFLIVELNDMSFEAFENKAQYEGHGAGTMAAQSIVNHKVHAVISNQYGPNAFMTLKAANIELYIFRGTISDALAKLKNKELTQANEPSNAGRPGMGGGRGGGQGRGRN